MANTKNWYYRLKVLEDHMDEAFDALVLADQWLRHRGQTGRSGPAL